MIDYDNIRRVVSKGLREYLKIPVIRSNQNESPPKYPFIGYNITSLANEYKGTYSEFEDGKARKPYVMTMSITSYSGDYTEAVYYANKAREWLDYVGTLYLNDNNVIVQSVGAISDRSNILTVEYEYSLGFDCYFWAYDETENPVLNANEYIETAEVNNSKFSKENDYDKLNEMLEKRLDGEL